MFDVDCFDVKTYTAPSDRQGPPDAPSGPSGHIPPAMPTTPPDPARLLTLPAPQGARLVLRDALGAADEAVAALATGGPADDGALRLHAALLRLRVLLQSWEPALRDTVPAPVHRRLTALARHVGTDASRQRQRAMLDALQTEDAAANTAELLPAPVHGAPDARRVIRERWAQIHAPLAKGLATWHERHAIDTGRTGGTFGILAAQALERAIARFERRWAALASPDELPVVHAAQTSAHAMHTLLAPLAGTMPDDEDVHHAVDSLCLHLDDVATAAALRQHLPIDTADATDFRNTEPRAVLHRLLTKRIAGDIRALGTWTVPRRRNDALARLRACAAAWRTTGAPPMEIERKWLLTALPPHAATAESVTLAQGYLDGTALVERIRSITRGDDVQWRRTVKLGTGMARIEVEEPAEPALAEALYALTAGRRVTKQRYTVHDGSLAWEIDVFTDRDLVLAELELPAIDAPYAMPDWLTPYVAREVTGEKAFTNWQLAR